MPCPLYNDHAVTFSFLKSGSEDFPWIQKSRERAIQATGPAGHRQGRR